MFKLIYTSFRLGPSSPTHRVLPKLIFALFWRRGMKSGPALPGTKLAGCRSIRRASDRHVTQRMTSVPSATDHRYALRAHSRIADDRKQKAQMASRASELRTPCCAPSVRVGVSACRRVGASVLRGANHRPNQCDSKLRPTQGRRRTGTAPPRSGFAHRRRSKTKRPNGFAMV